MFARLDAARSLTGNQYKIVAAAIIGDMLEFFDYYLIAFVLAFIIKPRKLTVLKSATILLSSGVGAVLGAFIWGADRRPVWQAQSVHADGVEFFDRQRAAIFRAR